VTKLSVRKLACTMLTFFSTLTIEARAQTFTTLVDFDGTNGFSPIAPLVQGINGNLYGTTEFGGTGAYCVLSYPPGCGTIFEVTPAGQLTTLYSFCSQPNCSDGYPTTGLVLAVNGNFYGTTSDGSNNGGTIFEITPAGQLTTLYNFCSQPNCADGAYPTALVQAAQGEFYGTTVGGGVAVNCRSAHGCGTIFKVTSRGVLTTLYNFCSQANCTDGYAPLGLVQASDGNLYGTTNSGGSGAFCAPLNDDDCGTIFRITPSGKFDTIYSFCSSTNCADGDGPYASLVQASNGKLYGTTRFGGATCGYNLGCGTVFGIVPNGKLTTLYSFCSQPDCADGEFPDAGLVQATDGNLYGTTEAGGGLHDVGTIFQITPARQLTTLYTFCSQTECTDGAYPQAGLVQATDGSLYGTAGSGGDTDCNSPYGCGTAFSLSMGLGPFVKTLPAAATVGTEVGILGNNLTGATSVTFNSVSAQFTVKSPTLIITHVPTDATTGAVQVRLPSGTLSSDVPFFVLR
jgi:uncharacterized repeat protein (TIGR03803 family)